MKALKYSLAAVATLKTADVLLEQHRFSLGAQAERKLDDKEIDDYIRMQNDDVVEALLKREFDGGDLSRADPVLRVRYDFKLKSREEHLREITDPRAEYDLLIVGGGANGAGVALEAASRGLKCAVVDAYDFASGTSSRSTKMAHGGIRYFEQMMKLEGDPFENFGLLKETLHERNYFLMAAPYQNRQLKLLIPSGGLLSSLLVYYPGCLLYHLLYLKQLMGSDYEAGVEGPSVIMKNRLRRLYPQLTALHGQSGVLMHETQMMDARMNLHALLTASVDGFIPGMRGANLANYTEFREFIKTPDGKIAGAIVYDKIAKKEHKVKAKVVVNCTGIHADEIRLKDNPNTFKRIIGAKGTHLVFKKGMLP
jgi:glycerol-3-phosphate dehydrogenase